MKPEPLVRVLLLLLAMIFSLVSVVGFLAPHLLFDPIGLSLEKIAVRAELRAAYGGFFGASAILFGLGAAREKFRNLALLVAWWILGGFTLGRLLSALLDGMPRHPLAIGNFAVEVVGFLATSALLWWSRATPDRKDPHTDG